MTLKQARKRIADLERRLRELEERPAPMIEHHYHYYGVPQPSPIFVPAPQPVWQPPYPYLGPALPYVITCAGAAAGPAIGAYELQLTGGCAPPPPMGFTAFDVNLSSVCAAPSPILVTGASSH